MIDAPFVWPTRREYWDLLVPGASIDIVKQHEDGRDIVRYPGVVVATQDDTQWVEVEARWTAGTVVQGPLVFESGDILREFFCREFPGNAFSLFSPQKVHKGWYANVTWPSWVEVRDGVPTLIWRDLILDFVAGPDRIVTDLDDDELDASGLATTDPALHAAIIAARLDLHAALASAATPFEIPETFDLAGEA